MYNFSEKTIDVLQKAGWYPGRAVDTSAYKEYLLPRGFFYGEKADDFLRSFGGLDICTSVRDTEYVKYMTLDPMDAVDEMWLENIQISSRNLGRPVTVIGYSNNGEVIFLMSEDQTIYADLAGALYVVGSSPRDAIEAFVRSDKLTRVN